MQHSTAQCSAVQCSTVQCSTAQYVRGLSVSSCPRSTSSESEDTFTHLGWRNASSNTTKCSDEATQYCVIVPTHLEEGERDGDWEEAVERRKREGEKTEREREKEGEENRRIDQRKERDERGNDGI